LIDGIYPRERSASDCGSGPAGLAELGLPAIYYGLLVLKWFPQDTGVLSALSNCPRIHGNRFECLSGLSFGSGRSLAALSVYGLFICAEQTDSVRIIVIKTKGANPEVRALLLPKRNSFPGSVSGSIERGCFGGDSVADGGRGVHAGDEGGPFLGIVAFKPDGFPCHIVYSVIASACILEDDHGVGALSAGNAAEVAPVKTDAVGFNAGGVHFCKKGVCIFGALANLVFTGNGAVLGELHAKVIGLNCGGDEKADHE